MLSASAISARLVAANPSARFNGAWPTAEQILLLHAALDQEAEAAIAAWEKWRRAVDFENLDYGSHRLLPLLHRNLVHVRAAPHPWLGRMKGLHRHSWVRNQRLFASVAALILDLRDELGTPVMLLKGAALAMHAYPDPGLRPMDDCDLLVPMEAVPGALALLERRGWRAHGWGDTGRPMTEMTAYRRRVAHSQGFLSSEADPSWKPVALDLHWRTLLNAGNDAELNANLWGRAITVSLPDGTPVLIPDSTDLLGQICIHGLCKNPVPSALGGGRHDPSARLCSPWRGHFAHRLAAFAAFRGRPGPYSAAIRRARLSRRHSGRSGSAGNSAATAFAPRLARRAGRVSGAG